jgi:hypothetical protein
MNKIRRFDDYRYTVIQPMEWGYDISPPMTLDDALNASVGTFPIVLSPPPQKGESKQLEMLLKRVVPKNQRKTCDVVGCSEIAIFQGVTKQGIFVTLWHDLCPCCFVVWVQEFIGSNK